MTHLQAQTSRYRLLFSVKRAVSRVSGKTFNTFKYLKFTHFEVKIIYFNDLESFIFYFLMI